MELHQIYPVSFEGRVKHTENQAFFSDTCV